MSASKNQFFESALSLPQAERVDLPVQLLQTLVPSAWPQILRQPLQALTVSFKFLVASADAYRSAATTARIERPQFNSGRKRDGFLERGGG
jgi:hypothetical protein